MRKSHALAFVLGLAQLGTACSGEGNGPSNTPPAAAFIPSCVLLVCTFADSSTDADGQLTAYSWDFGDGTAAAITKDAVHTYGAANTYPVRLAVTDDDGATSDLTRSVLVHAPANVSPTADFVSSCTGLACSFTGLGSDGDGAVVGFQWSFGDGAEAATQNATHGYASAGSYAVELTVTDDSGTTGRLSRQVTVTGSPPGGLTAGLAGSCVVTGRFGRLVFVDCTFIDQSTAPVGATVTAWAWDLGFGKTSTEPNPPVQHYAISWHPGVRVSVSLTVTDNTGLTDGVTSSIPVTAPETTAPTIALGVSPLLQNLCYPARQYSSRGCPSGAFVTIRNSGGGTLKWRSTTSAPWLRVSPRSGTAPSTIRVWVDGAALPPGSHSGDLLISATGATNTPRGVFVRVTR